MAATDRFRIAPPLNRFSIPRSWLLSKSCLRAPTFTPGTGTWATKRKTTSMARVKRSLVRRSGRRKASAMAWRRAGLLLFCTDDLGLAPRRLNLLAGLGGEGMGPDHQGMSQLPLGQDLHRQLQGLE